MNSPYNYKILNKHFPEQIPVYIEVSSNSRCKYEYDNNTGFLTLDRILHSSVVYPHNYGFVPQTLCDDGDPLDILVISTEILIPGTIVWVRPLGYMDMEDEKGKDEKVLAVLMNDPHFDEIKQLEQLGKHKLKEISFFFETYKKLEINKWVKIKNWYNKQDTLKLIKQCHAKFSQNSKHCISTQLWIRSPNIV